MFASQYLQSVNAMSLSHSFKEDDREEGKLKRGVRRHPIQSMETFCKNQAALAGGIRSRAIRTV
jgi:hypothetical protein